MAWASSTWVHVMHKGTWGVGILLEGKVWERKELVELEIICEIAKKVKSKVKPNDKSNGPWASITKRKGQACDACGLTQNWKLGDVCTFWRSPFPTCLKMIGPPSYNIPLTTLDFLKSDDQALTIGPPLSYICKKPSRSYPLISFPRII